MWLARHRDLDLSVSLRSSNVQVYESLVINEYLADAFPPGSELGASPLLPESPAGRAMARMIAQRSNDLVKVFFTYLSNDDDVRQL